MLNLRLLNRASQQAAPITYVEVPPATAQKNVSVMDYASLNSANIAEFHEAEHIVRVIEPSSNYLRPASSDSEVIYSSDFIVGNRAVLSTGIVHAPLLFYRHYLGKGPQFLVKRTGGSDVTVTITSTTLSFNGTHLNYTNRSTRWLVQKINEAKNGVEAQLLSSQEASLTSGTVTADANGQYVYGSSYSLVYAPNASTTDLDAARDTIKATIDVLADGQKTSLLNWDIWVESYNSTIGGFLCALYVDRKAYGGRTFSVRYDSIGSSTTVGRSKVEVINPETYITEGIQYDILEEDNEFRIDNLDTTNYSWAVGIFSKTGTSQVASVTRTAIQIGTASITYEDKTIPDLVSSINETMGSAVLATVLSDRGGPLLRDDLLVKTYSIKPSGTPIQLSMMTNIMLGPDTRLHAKLPYDYDIRSPWYPRISAGRFSERRQVINTGYGQNYGNLYGGASLSTTYGYSLQEYYNQVFASDYGRPFRHVTREEPVIIDEKTLRTRRYPLESIANLTLRSRTSDISSKIQDVDLEQGFIFLSENLADYDNLAVDYLYAERSLIYEDIDLNPRDNSGIIGKYVGVYCIPDKIGNGVWAASTDTVYHLIADDVQYIENALASAEFVNRNIEVRPILLGVYQVVENAAPSDVTFHDLDRLGGGLKEGVVPIEEANFVWDIGRADGDPFEGHGAVIIEVPESIVAASDNPPFAINPATSDSPFMDPTGQYKLSEIQQIADKWVAMGNAAIVEVDPDV